MIELFQFQATAASSIADRFITYVDDPVLAGSAKHPRNVPYFQSLAALTGAGKTVILAHAVSQMAGVLPTKPIVVWLSRGKVVVQQSYTNLAEGGKYHHLLDGAEVHPLGDYLPSKVAEVNESLLYFATVGTFNQRDKEDGSLTIYKSDVDNTETSTWEALKARKNSDGQRRPLLVVYDEGHNLSDQQTELLLELEPDAFLIASATMKLPARLAAEVDLLRRAGWTEKDLVTPVKSADVVSAGLVKSTLVLGGYNAAMEETVSSMLQDMHEAERDIETLGIDLKPKAIYVCNTNVVQDNASQIDDPTLPFSQRQAPPILIWRYLTEQCGIPPADVAVYSDLKTHRDAALPEDFVLFKGAENDYAAFTAGAYRHVIFNLSLQEGWDDPSAYFAYIDKSMNSRAQVTQVIGRVLRQPEAQHYASERLNAAHFYVRVDRNETFSEVLKEVGKSLGTDIPAIRLVATPPGRAPAVEFHPKAAATVPRTAIVNHRARGAVAEVLKALPDYRNDAANVRGSGSRRIARQDVGVAHTTSEWQTFEQASHVSLRWVLAREVRRRFQSALEVLDWADPRLNVSVAVGSPAYLHVVRLAEEIVREYVDNVRLKQRRPNPYVVGTALNREEEVTGYQHALHDGYSGLNPLEEDFATVIDATGIQWARNSPKTGYGIPLVSVGTTDNFYPDFLIWTARRVICLDTKGPHLVADTALRKLLLVEGQPTEARQLDIQFVSQGTWSRDLEKQDTDGYSSWGLGADGALRVRRFDGLEKLVAELIIDEDPDDEA